MLEIMACGSVMDQQAILDAIDQVRATLKDFTPGSKLTPDLDEAIAVLGVEGDGGCIDVLRRSLCSDHTAHRRHNTRAMLNLIEPGLRRRAGLPPSTWLG